MYLYSSERPPLSYTLTLTSRTTIVPNRQTKTQELAFPAQHLPKMTTTTHSPTNLQLILNVRVTLKASDLDTWLPVFKAVREKVLAEPECKFFLLGRVVDVDPLTQTSGIVPEGEVAVSWSEGFTESMEWLGGVQMKKGYYKEYFEKVVPLETSGEFVDGVCVVL